MFFYFLSFLDIPTALLTALLLTAGAVHAAPKIVVLEYQVTRNGQPFATVNEQYRTENNQYKLESITKGKGIYAMFGKRVLTSEGGLSAEGLRPKHFESTQNGKVNQSADFDWSSNSLNMNNKGVISTASLEKNAQDLASYAYQMMFLPKERMDEIALPITTGRSFHGYHYRIVARNETLETGAGRFSTMHIINASTDPKDDKKELWLGLEAYQLPVKIIMHDESGATIEQTLTSLHAE